MAVITVTCQDPRREDDFTDEREVILVRIRWLDRHVGWERWRDTLEWNPAMGSWKHHYELDCCPGVATLFKLTFG